MFEIDEDDMHSLLGNSPIGSYITRIHIHNLIGHTFIPTDCLLIYQVDYNGLRLMSNLDKVVDSIIMFKLLKIKEIIEETYYNV